MTEIDWDDYQHFKRAEFVCKCGCGRADMVPAFLARLQGIRDHFGVMKINSGFRCIDHDRAVNGAGVHPTGRAADIRVSGLDNFSLVDLAISRGMTGIGLKQHGDRAKRICHLDDTSGASRPIFWTYE